MAFASESDNQVRLRALLTREAKVDDQVVDYMLNTMKFEAIAEFASYFTAAEYEEGVGSDILKKVPGYTEPGGTTTVQFKLQRARLRTAWQLATGELQRAVQKRTTSESPVDWDAPLDPDVRKLQVVTFKNIYHLHIEPESSPSDMLYGRLFREFQRRCLSVIDLRRVRSAAQSATVMGQAKKQRLAEGLSILWDNAHSEQDTADHHFTTILEVLTALKVLMHGYAMTGTGERDSKAYPGTKVRDADLSGCLAYLDFCTGKALDHPGPASQCLAWLLDRDHQTRVKARSLYLESWPWAEALQVSRETHCAVLWTCGNARMVQQQTPVQPSHQELTPAPPDYPPPPRQPCSRFNTRYGCTPSQRDCPEQGLHVCSFRMRGNIPCNSPNHNRQHCPNNPNPDGVKGGGKKGGGKKGGGKKGGGKGAKGGKGKQNAHHGGWHAAW